MERGLGWILDLAGPQPLAGFSHGAAGISWALLPLAAATGDERFHQAAREALEYERSLHTGSASWPDLRHGDLGNLEVLALAAETLGAPGLDERVGRLAGGILGSIREHGWRCGVLGRGEMPGLMLGLAGIGHGLLGLAEPERVPSVLRLAPPPLSYRSSGAR
jgi:lantibiotic modifying enzyme